MNNKFLNLINVRHLLEHTVGAWPNGPGDSAFQAIDKSTDDLITTTLYTYPLEHPPGIFIL